MDRRHQAFNDGELVIDHLRQWCQAVGGARCVAVTHNATYAISQRLSLLTTLKGDHSPHRTVDRVLLSLS